MHNDTIKFYDAESHHYSLKRYPLVTQTYVQYLFKRRRDLFLDCLAKALEHLPEHPTILEIGCADGILFKQIEERFPGKFSKLIGMDISPKMVEVAKRTNTNNRASFYLRDELPNEKYDIVVELGVHPYDLDAELRYASEKLVPGGYFFYSAVGRRSLHVRFKMKGLDYTRDYRTYTHYQSIFRKYFDFVAGRVYGLFVPKLWAFPALGRVLQKPFDLVFGPLLPELFHETIYVLKKRST